MFVLITIIIIFAVVIYKKYSNSKADTKEQLRGNEMPSLPLEPIEDDIPMYASVDLSKKRRARQQEDIPMHAQCPGQIIYAELDLLHSTEVIPPPLPDRDAYSEIDCSQNSSHGDIVEPIYESVILE